MVLPIRAELAHIPPCMQHSIAMYAHGGGLFTVVTINYQSMHVVNPKPYAQALTLATVWCQLFSIRTLASLYISSQEPKTQVQLYVQDLHSCIVQLTKSTLPSKNKEHTLKREARCEG